MRGFVYILAFLCSTVLQQQLLASGQDLEYANRKWFEFNRTLYRIEVEAESKWKDAFGQCKKEKLNLIRTDSGTTPSELQDFIKRKFKEFPSFWVQNNSTNATLIQKIGFRLAKGGKGKTCNRMDKKTFAIVPEECDHKLGFICERQLRTGHSKHETKSHRYYIEPQSKYTCDEAKNQCAKQNMSLALASLYLNNILLKDYIFLNFGSSPTFWFAKGNNSLECYPLGRSSQAVEGANNGFICEKPVIRPFLTFRHWVLIISVSVVAFIAFIIFMICRCCLRRKVDEIESISQPQKKW